MTGHGAHDAGLGLVAALGPGIVVAVPAVLAAALHLGAVRSLRTRRPWPLHRTVLWLAGTTLVAASAVGPLAVRAHEDAVAHMVVHLLVGMVAPMLLVLAAPTTLALNALAAVQARRLARILRSRLARVVAHPVVATALHVGTMWLLYGTEAGRVALHDPVLHVLVLAHLVATGSLFTWSLVGVDPAPHRPRLAVRVGALVLAGAAHRILAVQLYGDAAVGASVAESQTAARVMSAGGDVVELALAVVLFGQWYRRRVAADHRARGTLGRDARRGAAGGGAAGGRAAGARAAGGRAVATS
ncbi:MULTISPECIES: cytochrome c oxidase assembly protein [unclassified Agrococcus]|uniref:cytochrome c oxidase assembly protein n=1 Tax=unclassified Agrococcus TaxID=2615065 RepID=UPI003612AD83